MNRWGAIINACRQRLRPIMMTTLAMGGDKQRMGEIQMLTSKVSPSLACQRISYGNAVLVR
ncbi:hypothetical protein ACK8HJ_02860 [Vreelandella titanicae]|uniref:hypothetical protein n=1 Tax=Vreelandella titanicae TaxID=664683 RepID=UPI003986A6FC